MTFRSCQEEKDEIIVTTYQQNNAGSNFQRNALCSEKDEN